MHRHRVSDTIIDQYSGFDHKKAMTGQTALGGIPSWVVDKQARRRLTASTIAKAYHENTARATFPASSEIAPYWREFGDAAAIADRVSAATIGDDLTFSVLGANDHLPAEPLIGAEPEMPEGSPSPIVLRKYEARIRVWEAQAARAIDEWEARQMMQPRLLARQSWLREFARVRRFEALVRENEAELITPLGDGIMVFTAVKGEFPRVELFEPDAYHPVWPDDGSQPEFPTKLHLAYEFDVQRGSLSERYLRRVTYELVDLVDDEGNPVERTTEYGTTSSTTCLLSDGMWKVGDQIHDLNRPGIDDLSPSKAEWKDSDEVDELGNPIPLDGFDLDIDFIPVVHFPSDLSTLTHFGRSVYLRIAQLLDAIAGNDTEGERSAALVGAPVIAMTGAMLDPDADGTIRYKAGQVITLGDKGGMDVLDMSGAVDSLGKRGRELQQRLSTVASVPEGVYGHVQANQIVSGVAMLLTFTAFRQMVQRRRLAREPKLNLALKFVQRLAIVAGEPTIDGSDVFETSVKFGAFMPSDVKLVVEVITQLADRGLMTETLAFTLLEVAGVELGDIDVIVAELRERDFEQAAVLMGVAGRRYAQRWLGIDPDDPDVEDPEPVADPLQTPPVDEVVDPANNQDDPAAS